MEDANKLTEYHLNRHQPNMPQFAIYEMHDYLQKHGEKASKAHIHSYYQILWFKKGKGKHFVDFKEYEILDNTLFFIAKNQVHYFDQNNYNGILMHFNEPLLIQNNNEVEFFLKFNLFNNPYQKPSCLLDYNTKIILDEYLNLITNELSGKNEFGQEEILRTYLKAVLIQVQRRKNEFEQDENQTPFLADEKRFQLMKFVNLVEENYKKGLNISAYAKLLFISSRTLSDLTHQLVGKTPSQIIQERIIVEAQRMLLHSNLNINQIGYDLGFEDPSYFVKYFKKYIKISPTEFRKLVS